MPVYNRDDIRDNCGFGLIAHLDGEPSHRLVRTAISALDRMDHRGAILADGKTGDGCGLLLQKPDTFFRAVAKEQGWSLSSRYGVGMVFLGHGPDRLQRVQQVFEEEIAAETLSIAGWRKVPIDPSVLGEIAARSLPVIMQVFVNGQYGWGPRDFERRLFMVRRKIEKRLTEDPDFYIPCLSNLVTIYKGLCRPGDLPQFYRDLGDLRMQACICLFHQRFSTNTLPRWPLAQPFRYLAHNGEINTITGNRQWAKNRSYKLQSPLLPDMQEAAPFVSTDGSDSASLDNMLETFLAGGMDLFRAFRLLIPPAWQNHPQMDEDLRAFYDFNSMHMEPWDGPAGIVMSDGRFAACGLDRNGLRPARYVITRDRLITLASEIGIWDYTPDEVVEKGRVGPGELLVVDTMNGRLWSSWDIDNELKSRHPYRTWLQRSCQCLVPTEELDDTQTGSRALSDDQLLSYQKLFGYSIDEVDQVLRVFAETGREPVASMGDDTPLAVLSHKPRLLFDYFRQTFAQVTNPPIDPLREQHVMSLATCIGREQNVFDETMGHANRVLFQSPVLVYSDLQQLKSLDEEHYRHIIIDLNYEKSEGLEQALRRVVDPAVSQTRNGAVLIILSDRNISRDHLPIPAAAAVGAVQTALAENNLRCDANIIIETAEARDPHHFAVLLGFGATAVYPYLVYESLAKMVDDGALRLDRRSAMVNYRTAINKGLLKIMSKMGISTIASYRCAQLFEAIGLSPAVIELCFKGVTSRIAGADFSDIQAASEVRGKTAWKRHLVLKGSGFFKYIHGGEFHAYNPDVVQTLQKAVRSGNRQDYLEYADLVNRRPVSSLRDLLGLKFPADSIAIDEVEPRENFFRRFDSAAMSIGALSAEAHESLAVAMNRLGGYSNSGEGGEDASRFNSDRVSKIKQVASGRFGVTPHYLMNAEVIQIKIAQGAKPGEGGQLPGHKVTAMIAKLRHSMPGVTLISPPPHHDIYSIEDLAQLIFDLKQINPEAQISVKLVSEPGVGTIATGVAKGYADMITISGYDGGTGASPMTSVKYAGSPWELGLVETHTALVENGLRHKIRLQVDGGLKTGLDIIKAAILGAESFGFGTAPLISLGCKYLRICHLNNCATGVATQDETLRRDHFKGLPEMAMNYFRFLAEETRQWMALLGVSRLTDLIGRTDLLEILAGENDKQRKLDLTDLLVAPEKPAETALYNTQRNQPHDEGRLNRLLVKTFAEAVVQSSGGRGYFTIRNTDRSVGAGLSGKIAALHGDRGMDSAPITVELDGTAGQSFGVWNAGGLRLVLTGDANDYVGKGMTGGMLVIRPPAGVSYRTHESVIIGNTCLYGATGGRLYGAGRAGERFAVRNSGAQAVVEGIGDNGCEYMTGGVVTILGETGINFGAGMTGGFAYVFDEFGHFTERVNLELVDVLPVIEFNMLREHLRGIVSAHLNETGSGRAEMILDNFVSYCGRFKLVKPKGLKVEDLLGKRGRSATELLMTTQ
ncbi:MAG: glutamate synthase large subunit [Desulfocapsaceae bacterium]